MDPALAFGVTQATVANHLTNDGLVAFRHVGGAAGSLLVPDLATAIPQPTDDGRTYRFVLRRGLTYSNGTPVRASDVRRGMERALTQNGAESTLGGSTFLSSLVGALTGVAMAAGGRGTMKTKLPFGTFLAAAALIASLWGEPIVTWYSGLYR